MTGIKFGDCHTWEDWKLLLTSCEIGLPEVRTNTVEIPGMDGNLDLSEALTGNIVYGNRTLKFGFRAVEALSGGWADMLSTVMAAIHGKKLKIIVDGDTEWYYHGRCQITSFSQKNTVGEIEIECDCEPYKHSIHNSYTVKL
jgi:hypothetical protein